MHRPARGPRPLHLGIRAIVAKSSARIHRRDLISQGILPLLFADEEHYGQVEQGRGWKIESVREIVGAGETSLMVKDETGREIELEARLLPRERGILLAGGILKHLRGSDEKPLHTVKDDSVSAESNGQQSVSAS